MAYNQVKVDLTKNQIEKIANAVKNDTSVTLRLTMSSNGPHSLPLTNKQFSKLSDGKLHDIELSKSQINNIKRHPELKKGGFLPLLTLIPLIASILGGVGGLTGGIASAVSSAKQNNETARHNQAVEKSLAGGLYLKPGGSGIRHKRGGCISTQDYDKLHHKILNLVGTIKDMNVKHGAGPVSSFLANIPLLGKFLGPLANSIGLGLKL